jgi:ubiquinone/menaquinone biosynthesis C-methylase UbiE
MKPFTFAVPDLSNFYAQPYCAEALESRRLGALDKAAHIEAMCMEMGSQINTVLEVGCGTGAVLQRLAAHHAGAAFTGVEIGAGRSRADEAVKSKSNIDILDYDGKKLPFEDASFDLVYATHVLEHVTDERSFLLEMRRVARQYVYVEVPCELHMRTSYKALQSSLMIGHINHYSFRSFAQKLETSGLRVVKLDIFDHSYGIHRFNSRWWKAAAKMALRQSLLALNKEFASQLFTYHVGALCVRSAPLTIQ